MDEDVFTDERIILNILALFKISLLKRIYTVSLMPNDWEEMSLKLTFTVPASAGMVSPKTGVPVTVAV